MVGRTRTTRHVQGNLRTAGREQMAMVRAVGLAPGVALWREYYDRRDQEALLGEVMRLAQEAPFYRPAMPRSGIRFSVEETNFGPLGWLSDVGGYRYASEHPVTG